MPEKSIYSCFDLTLTYEELAAREKKNFYSISVHDIATQAAVNRTTFYAHFQDKYDFLEYWKTEKFQIFVNGRLPEDASFNADNLRILIQIIFDFLLQARQHSTPGDKQFETIFENAIHKKLHRLLLKWLHEANTQGFSDDKVEAKALVVSWGVFGSALQWSRNTQNRSVEWMVEEIIEVILADLASFFDQRTLSLRLNNQTNLKLFKRLHFKYGVWLKASRSGWFFEVCCQLA